MNVVVEIVDRAIDRLGHGFQAGEMQDGGDGVLREDLVQRRPVADIALGNRFL